MISSTCLVNADTLEYIKTLPDDCIDLIATDPPYFRVKSCDWDNQWKSEADYLAWLDALLVEFWRVLKPNGSLYMFCGSRLASDTELLVRQRFDVLSHIVWAKPSGAWKRQHKEGLRAFFPATEHIINASSRPGDVVADFFMGSGSTIKAALRLGRIGLGVELEKERFEQTQREIFP
ncbi:site-specific DNA-methyltransferase [Serratia nematodiphila]